MWLVDTSAWIEYLTGSRLGRRIGAELPGRSEWLVPTIVQHELAKWPTREMGEAKADQLLAFTKTCVVAERDTAIAISAAELCVRHGLDTADAVICATTLACGAELLTCDSHFDGLADVAFSIKHP